MNRDNLPRHGKVDSSYMEEGLRLSKKRQRDGNTLREVFVG